MRIPFTSLQPSLVSRLLGLVMIALIVPMVVCFVLLYLSQEDARDQDVKDLRNTLSGQHQMQKSEFMQFMRAQAKTIGESLQEITRASIVENRDRTQVQNIVDALRKLEQVADIEIFKIVESQQHPYIESDLSADALAAHGTPEVVNIEIQGDGTQSSVVIAKARIWINRQVLADMDRETSSSLQVQLKEQDHRLESRNARDRETLFWALFGLAASLISTIIWSLRTILLKRIKLLNETCGQVLKGRHDVRVPVQGDDELGRVARSFNGVLDELVEQQETLEVLVEQRTIELEERNAELADAVSEAQAATQAKSDFLAVMTHEIRTPMNAVIGATELLKETKLSLEQDEHVDTVQESGRLLLALINDVLDFSKTDANKLELENVPFDLRYEFENVFRIMEGAICGRGLDLSFRIDETVPSSVRGDAVRLRQVLLNLLSNAGKFTSDGGVELTVQSEYSVSDECTLRFEVRDTGIGIPEETQSRLFEVFSQADSSTTRHYGGTGLGLAICKRLVALMSGEIGVESQEGDGSTFWFTVVLQRTTPAESRGVRMRTDLEGMRIAAVSTDTALVDDLYGFAAGWSAGLEVYSSDQLDLLEEQGKDVDVVLLDEQHANAKTTAVIQSLGVQSVVLSEQVEGDSAKLLRRAEIFHPGQRQVVRWNLGQVLRTMVPGRVQEVAVSQPDEPLVELNLLVAEDNAINQKIVMSMLKKLGCRVTLACNGQEAVDHLESATFDLVLLDWQMPIMDGIEAAKTIRIREGETGRERATLVALTANANTESRQHCLDAGMDDFMSKPVQKKKLAAMLAQWCDGREEPQPS